MTHAALVKGALFLILAIMDAAASDILVLRLRAELVRVRAVAAGGS